MNRLPICDEDLVPVVELVDRPGDTEKLARLAYVILASGSARKSDWARRYREEKREDANDKAIERWLGRLGPELFLCRLVDTETPLVLVGLTEIPRPPARLTPVRGPDRG